MIKAVYGALGVQQASRFLFLLAKFCVLLLHQLHSFSVFFVNLSGLDARRRKNPSPSLALQGFLGLIFYSHISVLSIKKLNVEREKFKSLKSRRARLRFARQAGKVAFLCLKVLLKRRTTFGLRLTANPFWSFFPATKQTSKGAEGSEVNESLPKVCFLLN